MSDYPLPNLFIPGVQKAGTTALASFLAQHPEVCLVEGKEAHVFDDPEYHFATDKLSFAKAKYKTKLRHYNGEKFILDATPITMLHPAFIRAAATTCPNAKHIVMLRDPVGRALSQYAMTKSRGLEPRSPLLAFLLEPWRMRGFHQKLPTAPFQSKYRDQSYLIRSRFQPQLKTLNQYFNIDNILVLQQQDLKLHHQRTLSEIFTFLNLLPVDIEEKKVFETNDQVSISWLEKLLLSIMTKL